MLRLCLCLIRTTANFTGVALFTFTERVECELSL